MAFDINPLGTTMHLRQLEREASEILARQEMQTEDTATTTRKRPTQKSWAARLAAFVLKPHHAS